MWDSVLLTLTGSLQGSLCVRKITARQMLETPQFSSSVYLWFMEPELSAFLIAAKFHPEQRAEVQKSQTAIKKPLFFCISVSSLTFEDTVFFQIFQKPGF